MVSTAPTCAKCQRRNIVTFRVEPEEALVKVTLGRWKTGVCPSCFDAEAEKAGIKYTLTDLDGQSWSGKPSPKNPFKRRR